MNDKIDKISNKCKYDDISSSLQSQRSNYRELNKENIIEEANKLLEEW